MNQEILDVIAKSLPAIQVEILRNELTKAKEYDSLKSQVRETQNTVDKQRIEISSLRSELKLHEDMDARVRQVETKERQLEVELLKKDVNCKVEVINQLNQLMFAAFRNPTVMKSYQVPVENMGFTMPVTETITKE